MKKKLFISAALMALAVGGLAGCSKGGGLNPSGSSSSNPSSSTNPTQIDYQKTNYNTFHNAAVNASKLSHDLNYASISGYANQAGQTVSATADVAYSNGWYYVSGDQSLASTVIDLMEMTANLVPEDQYTEYYVADGYGFAITTEQSGTQSGYNYTLVGEATFNKYGLLDYYYAKQTIDYNGTTYEVEVEYIFTYSHSGSVDPTVDPTPTGEGDYVQVSYSQFHSLAVNADKYNPGYSVAEITVVTYYNGDLYQQSEGTYVYSNGEWTYSYGDNIVSSSFFETKASRVTDDEGAEFYYSETKGFYVYETFTEIQEGIEVYVEDEVAFDSYGCVYYVIEKQSANYQGQDIEMIGIIEVVYS